MTSITLRGLTKHYGDLVALDGLDLHVPDGRITALLGPSGCGKTTTLELIGGLLHPSAGSVSFGDRDMAGVRAERRAAVMVFQEHLLFPYLTVGDNVGFGLRMRGVGKRARRRQIEAMLERVGLPGAADRRPQELSGGQQQRVALARALVVEPEVLLLDEPLSNLDRHLRDGMRELILEVQRDLHLTTVVVTHDQEEASVLADHLALLFDGRLAQVGTPRDLHDRPASAAVARFLGSPNLLPGIRRGEQVTTAVGELTVPRGVGDDGPVLVTIRPEAVVVAPVGGPNIVHGQVRAVRDLGARARLLVDVEAATITLDARPDALLALEPGSEVALRLPAESLWAMPTEDTEPAAPDDLASPGAARSEVPGDTSATDGLTTVEHDRH